MNYLDYILLLLFPVLFFFNYIVSLISISFIYKYFGYEVKTDQLEKKKFITKIILGSCFFIVIGLFVPEFHSTNSKLDLLLLVLPPMIIIYIIEVLQVLFLCIKNK